MIFFCAPDGFAHRDQAIAEGGENLPKLEEIKATVNAEMAKRVKEASETLRDVLTSPTPIIMEGKIAGFARQVRRSDARLQMPRSRERRSGSPRPELTSCHLSIVHARARSTTPCSNCSRPTCSRRRPPVSRARARSP